MVETLTESFCERCGTRYEFKAPTRLNPLRKTRGLFGGLKNYLTSQDALSDAMGDAMRSEEEQLAAAQLDAFHESFNFCIGCRQYTCLNCWNDAEGRCRNCAPVPGTDDLAERLAASVAGTGGQVLEPAPEAMSGFEQPPAGLEAWPTTDMPVGGGTASGSPVAEWPADDFATRPHLEVELEQEPVVADAEPEPEPVVAEVEPEPEPEPVVAEAEPEPEPVVAEVEPEPEPVIAEVEPEPEPEPVIAEVEPEPEPVAADIEPQPQLLRVVAWDEDAAYDVEPEPVAAEFEPAPEPIVAEVKAEPEPIVAEVEPEPEPVVAEVEPEPEPEPVAAEVEPEPEPVVAEVEPEPEPEPVAAEVEPEPEPPQPMRPIAPISETILHLPVRPQDAPAEEPPAVAAAADESPEVAARRAQLDLLGLGDADRAAAPEPPAALPYRSRGAAAGPIELAARAGGAGFWEASAREVAGASANIGVQNCGQCGLSLSASARFCRRCGSRQAQSA